MIFINTHENEFLHFLFVYLCYYYYEFTLESPEKERKGVEM